MIENNNKDKKNEKINEEILKNKRSEKTTKSKTKILDIFKQIGHSRLKRAPVQALNYLVECITQEGKSFDFTTFFVLSTYPWDEPKSV